MQLSLQIYVITVKHIYREQKHLPRLTTHQWLSYIQIALGAYVIFGVKEKYNKFLVLINHF